MKTKEELTQDIENFFQNLNLDFNPLDYISANEILDNIEGNYNYQDFFDDLDNSEAFNGEIIYYGNAIEYLLKHDPSLRDSLDIAYQLGFQIKELNSEILASVLATEINREDFAEHEHEIEDLFEYLEDELNSDKASD